MPFEKRTVMEQKIEFVKLASTGLLSMNSLCKRFNISRPTGYKWLSRFQAHGHQGLADRSRRPKCSPNKLCEELEALIVSYRLENPEWGAKKIYHLLRRAGLDIPPARSTIHAVLKRHNLVHVESSKGHRWKRFEHPYPNALWQMDFKGHFPLLNQAACHPLTITDDHSRFNLLLKACRQQTRNTVESSLKEVFRHYGLPEMILCDNGSPWAATGNHAESRRSLTILEKWLIRLNVKPIHGQAYHPQTQGKEERFHRTLKTELLNYQVIKNHQHCQDLFDEWRYKYNHIRPHEALDFKVPMDRYQPSTRSYPEVLPAIEYNSSDQVRKVCEKGFISFKGKKFKVGKALRNESVAIRTTIRDGHFDVYYCNHSIRQINLRV